MPLPLDVFAVDTLPETFVSEPSEPINLNTNTAMDPDPEKPPDAAKAIL